jgi:5'-nucleotidase
MPGYLHLTILHTNDLHGRVHQLARITTLVKRIHQEVEQAGGHCLYLDSGDSEDTTLIESALTRGSSMNALLKTAGCDQVALGNAIPLRYGPQAVSNLAEYFGKPLLCANLLDTQNNPFSGLQPFVIIEIQGLKIAVIGVTAPMGLYKDVFHCVCREPVDVFPELITKAKEDGAGMIIALTHIGSKSDIELAEKVRGIDLIIGGHDHKRIHPPILVYNTLIAQSGQYGEMLGRLDLVIDLASGRVISHTSELIPVNDELPEDPGLIKAQETEKARAFKLMHIKIGVSRIPIPSYADRESPTGNLLADAIFERVQGAQAALMLNGHWESGLEAGEISLGGVNTAIRSTGNPARVELAGAQIRQFLQNALKPENIANKPHPLRGIAVGWPHVAGMQVTVAGETMDIEIGNTPIQEDRKYIVATSDLELSDIMNYLFIPDDRVEYEVPTILPKVVEDYIRRHSPINEIQMGRIRMINS